MASFERRLVVAVPRSLLHDWHLRQGAFERLSVPWLPIRSIHAEPVADGAQRIFEVKKGGVWLRWVADHRDVIAGERFTDVQKKGPFRRWEHTHRFEVIDAGSSRLVDQVEYEVPLGFFGRAVAGGSIRKDVERMFAYRHRVTRGDLEQHGAHLARPPRRIAITGASGLIGRQLVAYLRTGGHTVYRLVRHDDEPADDEIRWSAAGGVRDLQRMEGLDAVVHLAGANIAQRWTEAARDEIRDSRVLGTRAVVEAIAKLDNPPAVLVASSGVGYYGDTADTVVDESAPLGEGFLAEVCAAWEAQTRRAEDFCRTVRLRTGIVLDPRGGVLAKLLPLFKSGLGGRVGSGEQLVSWVGLDDVLGVVLAALNDDALHGAVNLTGPEPATQAELARTLGRVLSRPAFAPAPAAAVKMIYGEMGRQTALASTGARPAQLLDRGYRFRAPTLEQALRHCLGRGATSVSEPD